MTRPGQDYNPMISSRLTECIPVWRLTGGQVVQADQNNTKKYFRAPELHPQFTIIGHFNFTPNGSIVTIIHILHFPGFVMIKH